MSIPFGPTHPFRQTTETARYAGKKGRAKSPWSKGMLSSSASLNRAKKSGFTESTARDTK